MKVFEENGIFKASRISGPKHNYLGIGFSDRECDTRIVEKRVGVDEPHRAMVDRTLVVNAVQEVVKSKTADQSRSVYVSVIEFVPTDTQDHQAYVELATAIVQYALQE